MFPGSCLFRVMKKKIFVYTTISLFLIVGISATRRPDVDAEFKNLKIIRKGIGVEEMDFIMYKFSHGLGVTCSYCHPDTKPGIMPIRVDFASDEKPEKKIAREMMQMTDKLNRKYFDLKNDYGFESFSKMKISCGTCHLGLTKPNNKMAIPTR